MDQLAQQTGRLLAALQFFTRPAMPEFLARHADHSAGLSRAAPLFGIVGLLIGVATACVWLVAASLLPPLVAAGVAIAFGVWLTGGLHEDGFADCADGLGTNRSGDEALTIMRDSRVGTYGATALILTVGLRWAALAVLTATTGALALVISHCVARAAIALPLRFSTYVRPSGTGSLVSDGITTTELVVATAVALVIATLLGGSAGLFAAFAGFVAATVALLGFERRIGGYTGDALGGMEQTAEIVVMVALAGLWAV